MISQGTQGDSPHDNVRGALTNPGTLWGCPLLFLAGSGTGDGNWFGSDQDPTVQIPDHFVVTQMKYLGWVSVWAGFTESQDKLLFSCPF